jgi:hypothetical protein
VKIRGHRIELGEIEAALAAQAGITQAVVVAREAAGGAQLVGYVTGSGVSEDALRRALGATLPDIMVPSRIVEVTRMPLTPNKKIDRKALPSPAAKVAAEVAHEVPVAQGTQAAIAQVWSAILGVGNIRPSDNFFALGGHSLLAVQAHRDIKTALGITSLGITDIFRFPTLEGLAAHLDKGKAPAATPAGETVETPAKAETISKRRAMRAGRAKADS